MFSQIFDNNPRLSGSGMVLGGDVVGLSVCVWGGGGSSLPSGASLGYFTS